MKNTNENLLNKYAVNISIISILIGLLVIVSFLIFSPFNDWSFNKDPELFSQFGNFIGGFIGPIFSFAAFFLIYKTLKTQQDSIRQQELLINQQKTIFLQQKFETTFFNLINNQNIIINNSKSYFYLLNDLTTIISHTVIGQDFFLYSKRELKDIWKSLTSLSYYEYYYEDKALYVQNQIDELYDPLSSNYKDSEEALEIEKQMENDLRLSQVNKYFGITKMIWDSSKNYDIIGNINLMYGLYFQRYEYVAGHYFRHLYHLLDFLELTENKLIKQMENSNDKDEIHKDFQKYASILQSQMSSLELMLLFYNALSFPKMLKLVIKYNLLENLALENLLDESHNGVNGIYFKSKSDLIFKNT